MHDGFENEIHYRQSDRFRKERGAVFMMQLLETGQAFYMLAGICLLGILTRLMTGQIYKRLWKESGNLAMTRNRHLKELRQKAENTYRVNQGLRDCRVWLEHQVSELKVLGVTLGGWNSLSFHLTWLELFMGGVGAFLSYWYRLDAFYIVLYGGGAVLLAMLTMLFDTGAGNSKRERLLISLQDHMENVMVPRLSRNMSLEDAEDGAKRGSRLMGREWKKPEGESKESRVTRLGAEHGSKLQSVKDSAETERRGSRRERQTVGKEQTAAASGEEVESVRDIDYLKRSLEQIAASREKNRALDENWLKELKPEEVELIGDILRQYLA